MKEADETIAADAISSLPFRRSRRRAAAIGLLSASLVFPMTVSAQVVDYPYGSTFGDAPATEEAGAEGAAAATGDAEAGAVDNRGFDVGSGGWQTQVIPFAEQLVTFTDNVGLSPDDEATEDLISTTSVGAVLEADASRLKLKGGAAIGFNKSLTRNSDDEYSANVDLKGEAEVFRDTAYVDFFGDVREQVLESNGRSSQNPRAARDERERVIRLGVSPSLRRSVDGLGDGEVRYAIRTVFGEGDVDDSWAQIYSMALNSDPALLDGATVGFDARYIDTRGNSDEDDQRQWTVAFRGDVPVSRKLAVIGAVGVDDFDPEPNFDDDVSGVFGNVGLRYSPSSLFTASGFVGWRYAGLDYGADLRYRLSRSWTLSANVNRSIDIGDESQAPLRFGSVFDADGRFIGFRTDDFTGGGDPASALTTNINEAFAFNPNTGQSGILGETEFEFENDTSIVHDLISWRLVDNVGKTRFLLGGNVQQRDFEGDRGDELFVTAFTVAERDIPATAWTLGANMSFNQFEAGEADDFDTRTVDFGLTAAYQLTRNVSVFTRYGFSQRFADEAGEEFIENFGLIGIRGEL